MQQWDYGHQKASPRFFNDFEDSWLEPPLLWWNYLFPQARIWVRTGHVFAHDALSELSVLWACGHQIDFKNQIEQWRKPACLPRGLPRWFPDHSFSFRGWLEIMLILLPRSFRENKLLTTIIVSWNRLLQALPRSHYLILPQALLRASADVGFTSAPPNLVSLHVTVLHEVFAAAQLNPLKQ